MVEWRDHQEQPPSAAPEPHINDFLDLRPKTTLKSLLSLKRSTQKKREEAIKTISAIESTKLVTSKECRARTTKQGHQKKKQKLGQCIKKKKILKLVVVLSKKKSLFLLLHHVILCLTTRWKYCINFYKASLNCKMINFDEGNV